MPEIDDSPQIYHCPFSALGEVPTGLGEIFSFVVRHLYQQGGASILPGESDTCAYRGRDGRACSLGSLMPDNEYSQALEGDLFLATSLGKYFLNHDVPTPFLSSLQEAHDEADAAPDLVHDLKTVATEYDLEWPPDIPDDSSPWRWD